MVDLSLNPTQEMLKNNARVFLTEQCPRTVVREIDESETGFSPELWRHVSEMGWVGMVLPEEYGGAASTFTDLAVILEEMGWACMPSPIHSSGVLSGLTILEAGSDSQKQQYLPAIASGERIVAFAHTEPDYGWGPEAVKLSAARSNGDFTLNGTKLFVPDAQVADSLVVTARTSEGLTLFLVDKGASGLSTRVVSGWTGDMLNEVVLENVRVPASAVLGESGKGWNYLEPVLDKATALLCAYMVGGSQQMLDTSVEYSRNRIAFSVPISTFQRVQDHIINIVNDLEGARWTTYEALWKLDEGHEGSEVKEAISMAKVVASDGFTRCTENAHYVHGGVAVDKKYGLYLYTKKSRSLFSYLGDPVFHRSRMAELMDL